MAYAPSRKNWSLSAGDGQKTVSAWFKDNNGNVTPLPSTATITLDTKAPVKGVLLIDDSFKLTWSGFDDGPGSGIAGYILVRGTSSYPACKEAAAINDTSDPAMLSFDDSGNTNPGTTYYYRVCAVDAAGNVSSGATVRKKR
jgi:hypothetical protein